MDVSRHKRRIMLIQALYLWENKNHKEQSETQQSESDLQYIWQELNNIEYSQASDDFDRSRFFGVIDNIQDIQKILIKHAPEWPLEKIASNDRTVLYLGIYELLHTDVPPAVIINESVELAKSFGGPRSSQFINGVLSSVNKAK